MGIGDRDMEIGAKFLNQGTCLSTRKAVLTEVRAE